VHLLQLLPECCGAANGRHTLFRKSVFCAKCLIAISAQPFVFDRFRDGKRQSRPPITQKEWHDPPLQESRQQYGFSPLAQVSQSYLQPASAEADDVGGTTSTTAAGTEPLNSK
jgi:hypothetical protein